MCERDIPLADESTLNRLEDCSGSGALGPLLDQVALEPGEGAGGNDVLCRAFQTGKPSIISSEQEALRRVLNVHFYTKCVGTLMSFTSIISVPFICPCLLVRFLDR